MRIAMIGAGYVGLTTSACLAELGHTVRCHDADHERIKALSRGDMPIYEPGLAEMVGRRRATGALRFSDSVEETVADAEIVILAVGTPSHEDGRIDISQVEEAARLIAPHLASGAVVVVKSTVSVGTARRIREVIAERRGSLDFTVASNPEFLREGSALTDFMEPDRIVIGADDRHSALALEEVYKPLTDRGAPCLTTATANAELIKHAANAFLALKIGFINDVANLCEKVGADVLEVSRGIGLDNRIGNAFLSAGPGYGGSCFPKDTRAFASTARANGAPQPLVESLITRNEERKLELARRIAAAAKVHGPRICVLGAAFKKNTDDVRQSPAMAIIGELVRSGLDVGVYDPKAGANGEAACPGADWFASPYEAATERDIVVVATEWDAFADLDLPRLASIMRSKCIFDLRNIIDQTEAEAAGFQYRGLGRPWRDHANVADTVAKDVDFKLHAASAKS